MTRKLMAAAVLMAAITATGAETDTPKIGEPVKLDKPVVFIGDSMMKMLGKGMEKAFKAKEVTPAESFSSLGSGLARPSVFNWPVKAKELCERVKPKTAFVSLGTNDRQNLESRSGSMAVVGTDEWRVEYKCRIEELLDALYTNGVTHAVWMLSTRSSSPASSPRLRATRSTVTGSTGTTWARCSRSGRGATPRLSSPRPARRSRCATRTASTFPSMAQKSSRRMCSEPTGPTRSNTQEAR